MVITRSSLFWDVLQRSLVVSYLRFGTTYRSHLQGILEDGIYSLYRNIGKLSINLRCRTSQKSEIIIYIAADA
jgi:hypothetical protein